MNSQNWTRSAVGLILGGLAIGLVTALLVAALSSSMSANKLQGLTREFSAAQERADRREAATLQRSAAAEDQRLTGLEQNKKLLREVGRLNQRVDDLMKYLRDHGIQVPASPTPASPKANPGKKATPKPKRPTTKPPAPATQTWCILPPPFCPIELPKVVPQ